MDDFTGAIGDATFKALASLRKAATHHLYMGADNVHGSTLELAETRLNRMVCHARGLPAWDHTLHPTRLLRLMYLHQRLEVCPGGRRQSALAAAADDEMFQVDAGGGGRSHDVTTALGIADLLAEAAGDDSEGVRQVPPGYAQRQENMLYHIAGGGGGADPRTEGPGAGAKGMGGGSGSGM